MKKQYWILYNGEEVIQVYEGEKEVGEISNGYCPTGKVMSSGTYIIFDGTMKNYKVDLLMYLINREEEIIKSHHNERNFYIDMLAKQKGSK